MQSLRELFIHLGGMYNPSQIIYPFWRDMQSLRELFSHLGGVYNPSVNYLAFGGVYNPSVNYLATWEGCTIPP